MQRRLFIAINLPDRAVREVDAEVAELERLFAQEPVRFLKPDTWHLTLTFLGSQDDEAVGEIVHAMEEAAREEEPFPVLFTELLYGPPGKPPRMLWLGADRESTARLAAVKERLDDLLRSRGVHIEESERRFTGHLTLARFAEPVRVRPALALARPIELEAASLDLMESFTERDGARYDLLGSVSFREL